MLLKKLKKHTLRNLLLRISLFPVGMIIASVMAVVIISSIMLEDRTDEYVREAGKQVVVETAETLKATGEATLREQTAAIVKQVDLFLRLHPGMTRAGLKKNRDFRNLVLRRSGDTGYSLIVDKTEERVLLHFRKGFEGLSLGKVIANHKNMQVPGTSGEHYSGYYWWNNDEGKRIKKFFYLMKVARRTSDRGEIAVACTIQYDEFVKPVATIQALMKGATERILLVSRRFIAVTGIIIFFLLGAGLLGAFSSFIIQVRKIERPIGELLDSTRQLKMGNLDHRVQIDEPVEFNLLADSFNQMTDELGEHQNQLEKKVEQRTTQIQLSEQKYRNLVESTGDIVFSLDSEFRFLTVNRALRRQLGFEPVEVLGTPLYDLLHSASEKEAQIDRSLFFDKLRSLENDGDTISVKTSFRQKYSTEPRDLRVKLEYFMTKPDVEILGKASGVAADSLQELLVGESQGYVTNNYIINAENISQRITRNLVKYVNKSTAVSIRISVREMIINAIEHGNLKISFKEKTEAQREGDYMQLLNERQNDARYSARKVEVDYALSQIEFSVRIKDQGEGFDHQAVMARGVEGVNREMMMHGRGINMAMAAFDRIVYNEAGNEVFLVKHIKG